MTFRDFEVGHKLENSIFNFSRKLIIFLVSISVLFILCGSIMLGAYFVCEAEYKHVQPVIVIGEVLDNDNPLDTRHHVQVQC